MIRTFVLALGIAFAGLALTGPASAHEFLIKPGSPAGGVLPFAVESTHIFMEPEEQEALADVKAFVMDAGGSKVEVPVKAAANGKSIEGTAKFSAQSAFLLGHRLGQVWSMTPGGMKPGGKDVHADAVFSNQYEKFAKALIGSSSVKAVTEPVGQRLEVVPLVHPSAIKAGNDFPVQILFDGQPLSTAVYATFDGFTGAGNSYAYFTETYAENDKSGLARIRVWSPGLWMVRVEHKISKPADGIRQGVFRSVLTFEVK
ncbi:MAG: DUF4198 domain-containing protein [Rhodospirillales bacterium]|nr:DUF4198 domain-containing protein [Rhodospirillales bacterium]